jgi:hypothetical protein
VLFNRFDSLLRLGLWLRKRRGWSHGSYRGSGCLDREVVHDGLDPGNLSDI